MRAEAGVQRWCGEGGGIFKLQLRLLEQLESQEISHPEAEPPPGSDPFRGRKRLEERVSQTKPHTEVNAE